MGSNANRLVKAWASNGLQISVDSKNHGYFSSFFFSSSTRLVGFAGRASAQRPATARRSRPKPLALGCLRRSASVSPQAQKLSLRLLPTMVFAVPPRWGGCQAAAAGSRLPSSPPPRHSRRRPTPSAPARSAASHSSPSRPSRRRRRVSPGGGGRRRQPGCG